MISSYAEIFLKRHGGEWSTTPSLPAATRSAGRTSFHTWSSHLATAWSSSATGRSGVGWCLMVRNGGFIRVEGDEGWSGDGVTCEPSRTMDQPGLDEWSVSTGRTVGGCDNQLQATIDQGSGRCCQWSGFKVGTSLGYCHSLGKSGGDNRGFYSLQH